MNEVRTCRCSIFFFQAEDGIRDRNVTGVQTCALPIYGAEAHQSLRFYCTGPLGPRHEADRGQGTVRSGDSRQENREPGKVYEKSPAPLQTGGTIKRIDHPAVLRGLAQFLKKATAEAPGIAKNDHLFAP